MHEIGALHKIAGLAEAAAKANNVRRIKAINIELGELSGMLPEFFEKYYSVAAERHETLKDSRLMIRIIPGEGLCCECGSLYNVVACRGSCPKCGSQNKKIISGTDLVVKNIVAETESGS